MELTEDEIIEKMGNDVDIAIELFYIHMNLNGVVFLAVSTYRSESMNSQKYNEKKILATE